MKYDVTNAEKTIRIEATILGKNANVRMRGIILYKVAHALLPCAMYHVPCWIHPSNLDGTLCFGRQMKWLTNIDLGLLWDFSNDGI